MKRIARPRSKREGCPQREGSRQLRVGGEQHFYTFKGTVPRDFRLQVYESVSPKPLSIPLDRFEFFRKFAEIIAAQGAPPVSLTPAASEKIFNQKSFNYDFVQWN